ncbi:MAG: undecaprenyl-diphosphate phosphatase [Paracoccaceae bacterium]
MTSFHLILIAIIQGVTEFLPVSSSGHLILLPQLTGMQDQGQVIDVAVHVGSLVAVILYFWADVKEACLGMTRLIRGKVDTPAASLALGLCIATVPVVLAGLVLKLTGWNEMLRSVALIGWTMLIFGVVLYWADRTGGTTKDIGRWTLKDAVIMGCWQAVALLPGTSRSGIVITGARRLGYNRQDSARISMLMSIPTIIASGLLIGAEVLTTADATAARNGAIAAVFSCIAALIALSLMMRLLRSISFTPYVIYRVALGLVLLVLAYS